MFFKLIIVLCFLTVTYYLVHLILKRGTESFGDQGLKIRTRSSIQEVKEEFRGSSSKHQNPHAPQHPKLSRQHHTRQPHFYPKPPRYTSGYYSGGGYYYPGYYNTYALPFLGDYPPVYNIEYIYPEDTMYTMLNTYDDRRGWYRIGVLLGNKKPCRGNCNNGESKNIILTLYRKTIDLDREIFEYKIIDDNKPGKLEIFLPTNIYFRLKDGDVIPQVTGYEDYSPMIVRLDNEFRYAVVRT